jgi:Golgi phosphoprotein 3 GPP34
VPTLAEDFLQLLLEDESGRNVAGGMETDYGLGGAILIDLVMAGRVTPAGEDDDAKEGRLVVRDPSPTGDAMLDGALRVLAEKPLGGRRAVEKLSKDAKEQVLARLVQRGMVREDRGGFLSRTTWPAVATEHEQRLVATIEAALADPAEPDLHAVNLISLLHAVGAVHEVIDPDTFPGGRKELKARAKQIAENSPLDDAVRAAIDTITVAIATILIANSSRIAQGI